MPNIKYYTLEEFKDICSKCKTAYYGDYMALDCKYCLVPKVCSLNTEYALTLKKAYQFLDDKDKLQSFFKKYFEGEKIND